MKYEVTGTHLVISGNSSVKREGIINITYKVITECTIDEGIIGIDSNSFGECTQLSKISLPNSLQYISDHAFQFTKIIKLHIPVNVSSISTSLLFYRTDEIEEITVDNCNAFYSSFNGCLYSKDFSKLLVVPTAKTSISFHSNIKRIESMCFYRIQIKKFIMPDSIESLSSMCFVDSFSVISIEFSPSSNLSSISASCFWNCGHKSFILPPKVSVLSDSTFYWNEITSFDIHPGSSLKKLTGNVFAGCQYLKTVHLPSTITEISDNAFGGCSALESVKIDPGSPFQCIDGSVYSDTAIIFLAINVENITIGPLVNKLPMSVLQSRENLTKVTVDENNMLFQYKEGVVYQNNFLNATAGIGGYREIVVDKRCACVNSYAFSGCSRLEKITFEDNSNLLYVKAKSFSGESKLKIAQMGKYSKHFLQEKRKQLFDYQPRLYQATHSSRPKN